MIKGIYYLSAIDCMLPEYEFESITSDFTFGLEKGLDGIYRFKFSNNYKQMVKLATKEQIDALGLEYTANELENYFLNNEPEK